MGMAINKCPVSLGQKLRFLNCQTCNLKQITNYLFICWDAGHIPKSENSVRVCIYIHKHTRCPKGCITELHSCPTERILYEPILRRYAIRIENGGKECEQFM
jgi:hypothetical protein